MSETMTLEELHAFIQELSFNDNAKVVLPISVTSGGLYKVGSDSGEAIVEKTIHPFGKGSLTTNGVQYSTAVSGIDDDAYDEVEAVTIEQPDGYTLEEIEFGLTGNLDVSGTPTDDALWKWQASDDGVSWQDLIAEQTLSAPSLATDVSCAGRFALTGNFLGAGSSFQVRMVAKCSGATDTVVAKTKSSSYIICRYRRA